MLSASMSELSITNIQLIEMPDTKEYIAGKTLLILGRYQARGSAYPTITG